MTSTDSTLYAPEKIVLHNDTATLTSATARLDSNNRQCLSRQENKVQTIFQ